MSEWKPVTRDYPPPDGNVWLVAFGMGAVTVAVREDEDTWREVAWGHSYAEQLPTVRAYIDIPEVPESFRI